MSAISKQQAIDRIKAALDAESDTTDPAGSRQRIANALGNILYDFVIDRNVTVPAVGLNAGAVVVTGTATGKIQ